MVKGCVLSTGYLPGGGLPRNSVDRITDRPDMTSAVDRGRKASTQTNKKPNTTIILLIMAIVNGRLPFIWQINYSKSFNEENLQQRTKLTE